MLGMGRRKHRLYAIWASCLLILRSDGALTLSSANSLDAVDWRILRELEADGRVPLAQLGRRVALSPPAVADRVRRLERAGIIVGYRAEIDAGALGSPVAAFLQIKLLGTRGEKIPALARELREVVECHRTTGETCFILKIRAASIQHLGELIERFAPYGQSITSVILESPVPDRVYRLPADAGGTRT
jgi:Lrp/AsnC family leucine-responsive transcriptional regulator